MLPFDMLGTALGQLPSLSHYTYDPSIRVLVVSFGVNVLLSVLTALVCFRFLRRFEFSVNHSIAGVLALLFCTTHLHYTQNMMENNYIMLLTLAGFTFQYEWLRSGNQRALILGSAALGLNLLTRLTTGMDLVAVGLFLLLVAWFTNVRGRALRDGLRREDVVEVGDVHPRHSRRRAGPIDLTGRRVYGRAPAK